METLVPTIRATIADLLILAAPLFGVWAAFGRLEAHPANDDFLYARSVEILVHQHRWQCVLIEGNLSPTALTPVVASAAVCSVVGFSYRALHFVSCLMTWLGAAGLYAVARQSGADRRTALASGVLVLACPWIFGHAFTFMTETTAVACTIGAIALFQRGLLRDSLGWIVAGSAVSLLAVWTRQTSLGVLLLPSLAAAINWRRGRTSPGRFLIVSACACVAPVVGLLGMELGWYGQSNATRIAFIAQRSANLGEELKRMINTGCGAALIVGLSLLPAMPSLLRTNRPLSRGAFFALAFGFFPLVRFCATLGQAPLTSITGPFLANAHLGPILTSDCFESGRWNGMGGVVWPTWVWQAASLLAAANFALICCRGFESLVDGWRKDSDKDAGTEAPAFVAGAASGLVLFVLLGFHFDRYWLAAVTPLFAWAGMRNARLASTATSLSGLCIAAALWIVCVVFVHDYLAWNQARWRLFEAYREAGFRQEQIDGGYEVNGWFRSAEDPMTLPRKGEEQFRWWSGRATRFLAVGPRPGMETDRVQPWFSWAAWRRCDILGLKRSATPSPPLQRSNP